MRRATLIGIMTAVLPTLANSAPVQWSSAVGGNDHWYEFVPTFLSWNDARMASLNSQHMGSNGYLATITSQAEQDFLNSNWLFNSNYWLGGSDQLSEGDWIWVDGPEAGQAVGGALYDNWNAGEPNNLFFNVPPENYMYGWVNADGAWNDNPGTQQYFYLVEYGGQPQAVPLPASLPLLLCGIAILGRMRHGRGKNV
ncbi:MAG: lectin-like protein [Paracoccaceae bacterium]